MTKVLIFGSQSDIGQDLVKMLKDRIDIKLICIHFYVYSVDYFNYPDWYSPNVEIERETRTSVGNRQGKLATALYHHLENDVDYIINCHEQPLTSCSQNNPTEDLLYNVNDCSLLGYIANEVSFEGLFINLSSFHVYGNAPVAMPYVIEESRFDIRVADNEHEESLELKFGYDSAHGISEKMFDAPKQLNTYGNHKMLCEHHVNSYAEAGGYDVLTLRLPYMIRYRIADKYKTTQCDRINNILARLVRGDQIESTLDNREKTVYDFLTPEYVADFLYDIVTNRDILVGTFNIGCGEDNEFSELELLKALQEFGVDVKFHNKTPDDWELGLAYYWADCRALHKALEMHTTKLKPAPSIEAIANNYIARFKKGAK